VKPALQVGAFFMSRMLLKILVVFQRLRLTAGSSARHSCDMKQESPMGPPADARRAIEARLKHVKTWCGRLEHRGRSLEQDEQCHSVLASEDMLSLLWNGVAGRREKTRAGKIMPEDERKFLVEAVDSPINPSEMEFLSRDPARHGTMKQARGVADFLRDVFNLMQNSNCESVVQVPKALPAPARLAREIEEHANDRLARARSNRFMARMYGLFGPNRNSDRLAAEAEKDAAAAAALTGAAQILAEQSKEDAGPLPREREATPREKWVCDQISQAMVSTFGQPLDNLAAQVASMLLNRTVSRRVVRLARERRGWR
jgi:hypothetical protein